MCLFPKQLLNKKYVANKTNKGVIPPFPLKDGKPDIRVQYVPVKCGKCMECMKQKANDWRVRLQEEIRTNWNGHFVTLTFSDEWYSALSQDVDDESDIKLDGYDKENAIVTLAMRRFRERWRRKYKKSVKRWLVTELGHQGTQNIHLHGIIFTDLNADAIRERWQYGFVWDSTENNGFVNDKTINYIVKYIHKQDLDHKSYIPKIFTSPAIGAGYINRIDSRLNEFIRGNTKTYYKNRQGYKFALPQYYKNKLYTEDQKEILWQELLDKEERFVLGSKIDVKLNPKNYDTQLKYAQALNKVLGYNDDSVNWEKRHRERYLANLNHLKRKQRAYKKRKT